eukprot:scaffold442_cov397-Prasinococcus_capsulatus_cf.AAC.35
MKNAKQHRYCMHYLLTLHYVDIWRTPPTPDAACVPIGARQRALQSCARLAESSNHGQTSAGRRDRPAHAVEL